MQIPLQDFTDYWPMMGQLSPALQRQLQHELVPLVPIIVSLATALVVAGRDDAPENGHARLYLHVPFCACRFADAA